MSEICFVSISEIAEWAVFLYSLIVIDVGEGFVIKHVGLAANL